MTNLDLDAIKAEVGEMRGRAEKATPGPWAYKNLGDKGGNACGVSTFAIDEDINNGDVELVSGVIEEYYDSEANDYWDIDIHGRRVIDIEDICFLDEGSQDPMGDGVFIAHSRTDLPRCFDLIDSLIERVKELEKE